MAFLSSFFDVLFSPVMQFGPIWTIVTASLLVSFIFALINRLTVDPKEMKQIKEKLKQLQGLTKDARKSGDNKKMKELFDRSMENNHKMMKMQFKPLLISMVFVIVLLPWLAGTYGDVQIPVKDGEGSLTSKGETFAVSVQDNTLTFTQPFEATVAEGETVEFRGKEWTAVFNEKKSQAVLQNVKFDLPIAIPLLARDAIVGWLGLYILVSIPATFLFRKLLGVD